MKSYTFRISFLATLCLASCAPSEIKYDLPIPDKIEVKKSPEHVQISGTRIFIIPPKGMKMDTFRRQLHNDPFTGIHFMEFTNKSFALIRERQMSKFLFAKEKKPESKDLHFYKRFMLGKDSAAVVYRTDPKTKAGKINWVVGGSNYSISVEGTFRANKTAVRDEILTALKSIYIDTTAYVDYAAISGYTIDMTSTVFKQHHRENEIVYYTSEKAGGIWHNNATIVTTPIPLITENDFEVAVRSYLQNTERVDKLYPLVEEIRKLRINGQQAIECSYLLTRPNGTRRYLLLIISDGQRSIIFSGSVPPSEIKLFRVMKEFAGTIRMI